MDSPNNPESAMDVALQRFVNAQKHGYEHGTTYATAIAELRAGRKRAHWVWYVLPQLRGLGRTATSERFGLLDRTEAIAYWQHPVLGARLRESIEAVLSHPGVPMGELLGTDDARKLCSCLTLFEAAVPDEPLFAAALEACFDGRRDRRTLAMLASTRGTDPTP